MNKIPRLQTVCHPASVGWWRMFFRPPAFGRFVLRLVLPAIGLSLYLLFELPAPDYLPGLILLATPTATVAYVMAKEMKGDTELAVAAISASTLLSAITFTFWLSLVGAAAR